MYDAWSSLVTAWSGSRWLTFGCRLYMLSVKSTIRTAWPGLSGFLMFPIGRKKKLNECVCHIRFKSIYWYRHLNAQSFLPSHSIAHSVQELQTSAQLKSTFPSVDVFSVPSWRKGVFWSGRCLCGLPPVSTLPGLFEWSGRTTTRSQRCSVECCETSRGQVRFREETQTLLPQKNLRVKEKTETGWIL